MRDCTRAISMVVAVLLAGGAWADDSLPAPPAAHVSGSGYLRDIMHRLDSTWYDRVKTELESEQERARYLERLTGALAEMAGTTDALAESAPSLPLDAAGQARFADLARHLHARVARMRELAEHNDFTGLRQAYSEVEQTCRQCHSLYRDPRPSAGH